MNKNWVYLIIFATALLSLFYDKQIMLIISQSRTGLLDALALWLTRSLIIILISLLMITLFLWTGNKRKGIIPLWLSVGAAAALTSLLKIIVLRIRPFEALNLPLVQGADYAFAAWNSSFPSSHAAVVFSMVPILDEEFPKLKPFWVTLALLISLSRVYLGVHYLSDVLSGCLLGLLIGHGIILSGKRWFFKWKRKKN